MWSEPAATGAPNTDDGAAGSAVDTPAIGIVTLSVGPARPLVTTPATTPPTTTSDAASTPGPRADWSTGTRSATRAVVR